mgnify:CR=1 FL=1
MSIYYPCNQGCINGWRQTGACGSSFHPSRLHRIPATLSMNRLTRIFLSLSLSLVLGSALAGIENSTPAQRSQLMTAFMKDQLKFDAAAIPKLQAINLKYAEMAEPILKGDDNLFKKRSKMHDLMDAKDKELKAILSKEQFELYDSKKDELKDYIESHL